MPFNPSAASETQVAAVRRKVAGWYERYLLGTGLDLGCGPSTIVPNARGWDIARGDGDATLLTGVESDTYDFVYSSHLLEHLDRPKLALANWWRVLKPGGYLLLSVPEEDSYERGLWPSLQNTDHRSTWTAWKAETWSPDSYSMLTVLGLLPHSKLHSLQIVQDQTQWASVEAVIQKLAVQPRLVDSVVANAICMCGSYDLLFRGTNLAGNMTFECLACGQHIHMSLLEHAELAEKNRQIMLSARGALAHEPGSTG